MVDHSRGSQFINLIDISYCPFKEGTRETTPIPVGFPARPWTEEGSRRQERREAHSLSRSWIGWRMREEGYPVDGARPWQGEALTDGFKPPLKFEGRKNNVAAGAGGFELEF